MERTFHHELLGRSAATAGFERKRSLAYLHRRYAFIFSLIVVQKKNNLERMVHHFWRCRIYGLDGGYYFLFFQLDLLDSGDPSIGGIPDIVMFSFVPPAIANLYLNFVTTKNKWVLTSLFVAFSLLSEYLLVKAGFLIQKKGWHVWYSIPFYFFCSFMYSFRGIFASSGLQKLQTKSNKTMHLSSREFANQRDSLFHGPCNQMDGVS